MSNVSRMTDKVVIDKCFLQGSKKSHIRELAASRRLVISEALFFELLTSSEPGRSRCFAKLPQTDNPVDLVSHIGTLMRIEIDTQLPAGKPSSHREELHFRLNPALLQPDYQLPEQAQEAVEEQAAQLKSDVQLFIERAAVVNSFFPDLLIGSDARREEARAEAEKAIAAPGALSEFYAGLKPPPGERPLPSASLVNESWALYRWLQVQFLFAVDLYVRYQGRVPQRFGRATYEKLEHDVLDAQILMLGCLEGAIATREGKIKRWWRLLCPDGALYE